MRKVTLLTFLVLLILPARASAHVLISDTSRQVGAVLHITPDDDPVAGEPSGLFFDIQNTDVTHDKYSFSLTVTDAEGTQTTVPISINGTTVSASHVFPFQAAYTITLKAEPSDMSKKTLYFEQAQRVSRGIINETSPTPTHAWAEIGIVAGVCSLLVIGVIGYNKQREIHAYVTTHH